jgi:hypothetical protein
VVLPVDAALVAVVPLHAAVVVDVVLQLSQRLSRNRKKRVGMKRSLKKRLHHLYERVVVGVVVLVGVVQPHHCVLVDAGVAVDVAHRHLPRKSLLRNRRVVMRRKKRLPHLLLVVVVVLVVVVAHVVVDLQVCVVVAVVPHVGEVGLQGRPLLRMMMMGNNNVTINRICRYIIKIINHLFMFN